MDSPRSTRKLLFVGALLVLAVALVYGQTRRHDAIHFDDHAYLVDNYQVQRGLTAEGFRWAFAVDEWSNFHPATWLSHMLDCELFGMDLGLHHLSSVVLHAVNALLLLWLWHSLSGALWPSALVAALFALHPLNVESVAWLAERKNVLSTFFWFASTIAYVAWVRRPAAWRYALVALLLVLGLLAKPMLVTLPFTLLLLDHWPLRRTAERSPRQLVVEKLPLFAVVIAQSCLTFFLHRELASAADQAYPFATRAANAIVSYAAYLGLAVWPHDLAIVYPLGGEIGGGAVVASAVVLAAISFAVWRWRAELPHLLVGWLWFLGTLVPVIGLVQVGGHTMADRYAYVPLVGVFVMAAWSASSAALRWPRARGAIAGALGVALVVLAVQARAQTALWKDSVTLFEHTLAVTENNAVIEGALGVALGERGRHDEQIAHLAEARRLTPTSPTVLHDLGSAYASNGRLEDAMECFEAALAVRPESAETHTLLGFTLTRLGRNTEALAHYREALRIKPDYSEVHLGLAALYESQQRSHDAIAHYREALRVKPTSIEAHTNVGKLLAIRGEYAEAILHFRAVLELDPKRLAARNNLGHALAAQGKREEAIATFHESLAIEPNQPQVQSAIAALQKR